MLNEGIHDKHPTKGTQGSGLYSIEKPDRHLRIMFNKQIIGTLERRMFIGFESSIVSAIAHEQWLQERLEQRQNILKSLLS